MAKDDSGGDPFGDHAELSRGPPGAMQPDPVIFRDLAYVFVAAVLGATVAWLARPRARLRPPPGLARSLERLIRSILRRRWECVVRQDIKAAAGRRIRRPERGTRRRVVRLTSCKGPAATWPSSRVACSIALSRAARWLRDHLWARGCTCFERFPHRHCPSPGIPPGSRCRVRGGAGPGGTPAAPGGHGVNRSYARPRLP